MLALLTGFAAGSLHVLTGPDHLAAVAPLAANAPLQPWKHGLRWGMGHSVGVAVVGVVLIALRSSMDLERFSGWAEMGVGVVLVILGLWTLRRSLSSRLHIHHHAHGDEQHVHFHLHADRTAHAPRASSAHHHSHTALGIGALHGLAGSSHFFAVLPALALPRVVDSVLYLAAYAVGTIVAMSAFTQIIGRFVLGMIRPGLLAYRWALGSIAMLTTCVGLWWIGAAV